MRTLIEYRSLLGRARRVPPRPIRSTPSRCRPPSRPRSPAHRPPAADDKQLLETAAVIGKDVPLALLQAVAEESEETLHRQLGHLQTAEFLYETSLSPDPGFTFKHALTHEVTYGRLL